MTTKNIIYVVDRERYVFLQHAEALAYFSKEDGFNSLILKIKMATS